MKRKVRMFIYALVAWFVGMAVIAADLAECCAADAYEEKDIDYRWFQAGDEAGTTLSTTYNYDLWNGATSKKALFPNFASNLEKKYTGYFSWWGTYSNYSGSFTSDTEIVAYVDCGITEDLLDSSGLYLDRNYKDAITSNPDLYKKMVAGGVVSKSQICAAYYKGTYKDAAFSYGNLVGPAYSNSTTYSGDSYELYNCMNPYDGNFDFGFYAGKMKMFDSYKHAVEYLKTGVANGLLTDGKEYDGDNIYLNDFQMIVHDSNAYSAYYLEFKYTIPEQLRDAASLQLQIEQSYEWTSCALGDSIRRPYTYTGNNYIDLLQYPTGFKLYLSEINSIQQFLDSFQLTHHQRAVLGAESIIDMSALSIGGFGGESIMRITNSKLYMTCYVIANNKFGVNYTGAVDFMTGANDMSSYTPDSSGNYKYNGDLKNQGHYYTDVATDAAGNTTYNYYYYGTDNSKTEITAKDSTDNTVSSAGTVGSIVNNITMPDHIFVSVSGSSGSGGSSSGSGVGDVTIEDDDLSFDSLRESIKDGYGLIDDTDTGEKGDGLVAMMSDLFGYLPASFTGLIMLGMSSVVGIAILRMIFKR